ncbi:MAG: haloacid dehalogenase-like hydrolase [Succinivibrionaceae bacterium]|nr:haloacid dehalogenase-like hydrolase [Succinivibrionaceae bacterium]
MNDINKKSAILITALAVCLTASVCFSVFRGSSVPEPLPCSGNNAEAAVQTPASKLKSDDEFLDLWSSDAPARIALLSYLKDIDNPDGVNFIPEGDRIAVFDFDGTLFNETDPNYFDYMLLEYRVAKDPSYKDKASAFEKETAEKIREQNETGKAFKGLEVDHGRAVASSFAGMTLEEFDDYIQEFKKQPMPGYNGMHRGEGFYLPMLQIIDLLQKKNFKVYIVSGTDRFIVRGIIHNSVLNLPDSQIIGSDETLVSSGQKDVNGLDYTFSRDDRLILGGDFIIKNLKMNKVSVIMKEIGRKPVLAFGNSTGDSSMAQFVTSGNKYRSLAFMLAADDLERENGSAGKAEKMINICKENGWIAVSMKNDWKTIYGDKVTKK